MLKIKQEWSKSYPQRPEDHIISHVLLNEKKRFKYSYENDSCPPPMNWIIGWEYARKWLNERNEFIKQRIDSSKPKRIINDYHKWLQKRKPKANKSCAPQGITNLKKSANKDKTTAKSK